MRSPARCAAAALLAVLTVGAATATAAPAALAASGGGSGGENLVVTVPPATITCTSGGKQLASDPALTAGEKISCTVTRLAAGEKATATMDSAAASIGTGTVGSNGTVTLTVTIPSGLAAGKHTLKITGSTSRAQITWALTTTAASKASKAATAKAPAARRSSSAGGGGQPAPQSGGLTSPPAGSKTRPLPLPSLGKSLSPLPSPGTSAGALLPHARSTPALPGVPAYSQGGSATTGFSMTTDYIASMTIVGILVLLGGGWIVLTVLRRRADMAKPLRFGPVASVPPADAFLMRLPWWRNRGGR